MAKTFFSNECKRMRMLPLHSFVFRFLHFVNCNLKRKNLAYIVNNEYISMVFTILQGCFTYSNVRVWLILCLEFGDSW